MSLITEVEYHQKKRHSSFSYLCFKNHEKSHITSEVFILEKLNLRVKD